MTIAAPHRVALTLKVTVSGSERERNVNIIDMGKLGKRWNKALQIVYFSLDNIEVFNITISSSSNSRVFIVWLWLHQCPEYMLHN